MGLSEEDRSHLLVLRQRAEEMLEGKQVAVNDMSAEDIQYLLHELQVHQAELEIQNAELREIQMELELSRDQYADLYNFAPAGYCTIDRKDHILEGNLTLANLLGIEKRALIHQTLSHFVARMDQDKYFLYCRRAFENRKRQSSEIRLVKKTGELIYAHLESMLADGDNTKVMMMLIDITDRRDLEHRLIEQREKERQKIARDLHDGPVQMLSAINFTLRGILIDYPGVELTKAIEAIQASVREQIQILRNYSVELRSPLLANIGLDKAIRSNLESFGYQHPDILIRLALHPVGNLLSEEGTLALFRIFQEALQNISKHVLSTVTVLTVRLDQDEHHVRLEIQDNGEGFDLPENWFAFVRDGHLGLVGMRERAEVVGGHLEVQSHRGEGTLIKVLVPFDHATRKKPA